MESIWAFGINCDYCNWGLHNNGNFVQHGLLGGKFEVNVGGAAYDEESGTHSGIQSRTEEKEGKHLNISRETGWSSNLTLLGSGQLTCMKHQLPRVQLITPDDGHRRCPKYVEFRDKIKNFGNLMYLVGYL